MHKIIDISWQMPKVDSLSTDTAEQNESECYNQHTLKGEK